MKITGKDTELVLEIFFKKLDAANSLHTKRATHVLFTSYEACISLSNPQLIQKKTGVSRPEVVCQCYSSVTSLACQTVCGRPKNSLVTVAHFP